MEPAHNFDFNDKIRISETSFRSALSELAELHRVAHEDNAKGKPIEFDDIAACPFCSISSTIHNNEALKTLTIALFSKLTEEFKLTPAIALTFTLGFNIPRLVEAVFVHGYAIGMKCGRTDAIGEFTGVK